MRQIPSKPSILFTVLFLLLVTVATLTNCRQDKEESNSSVSSSIEEASGPGLPEGIPIRVRAEKIYLRSEAGINGEVIAEITRNELVFGTGEVSSFVTQLQKEGQAYEAPWLKIRTLDGRQGWVFASEAFLEIEEKQPTFFLEKRLEATFGKELARSFQQYERSKDSIGSAAELSASMRALRQLQSALQEHINQTGEKTTAYWIRDLLPELIIHSEEEDPSKELYLDFRPWRKLAGQTAESTDDLFLDLCITAYPEDSIEYRFPAWFFPTSPNDGHSLLGRGIHLEMFEKIDKLSKLTPLFNSELAMFKNALIEDIILLNMTYWEERGKAVSELEEILKHNFTFLEPSDRLALKNRLEAFKKSEESGILFNFKSGIH